MAYCSVDDVKTYRGISGSADDKLIAALITRAQQFIDNYTGRTFEAFSDQARYITVGEDTVGKNLYLPWDLCQITSVVTDADGTPVTLAANTDYVPVPRYKTPYTALRMLGSSPYDWDYTDDPETGVAITGRWAYSLAAPADIAHACVRLAAYYYTQKDAQVFDVTANPEIGVITVPKGLPADIKKLLDAYRRVDL